MEWPSSPSDVASVSDAVSDAGSDTVVMANDRFLALPNEVFGLILTFLDLKSIKRLRLASTQYAEKCLCPAFTRYYSHQETDLSPSSLQRLLQLTAHPVLGPSISEIEVVAVYYDPSRHVFLIRVLSPITASDPPVQGHLAQQLLKSTLDLSWIMSRRQEQQGQFVDDLVTSFAQIFENLGSLGSLRLRTRIIRDRSMRDESEDPARMNWNALWADCQRLLKIVTLAMTRSKVSVDTLSIFDQSFGKVQSGAFAEVSSHLSSRGFMAAAGDKIKNLNLSFSTETVEPHQDIVVWRDGQPFHAEGEHTPWPHLVIPGIAAFLKQTPKLEGLDLCMYNTLQQSAQRAHWAQLAYDQVSVLVSREVRLPNLRRLTLRGIWVTSDTLLLLLRSHPDITDLDLREIHISGGTWSPILEHVQSMQKLSRLHLENLWGSSGHLLNLEPTDPLFDDGKRGDGHSYRTRNGVMVYARDISMEELRQEGGLRFVNKPGKHRGVGSRSLMSWLRDRRRAYGPPK